MQTACNFVGLYVTRLCEDLCIPERRSFDGLGSRGELQGWLGVPEPTLQLRRLGLVFSSLKDSPVTAAAAAC